MVEDLSIVKDYNLYTLGILTSRLKGRAEGNPPWSFYILMEAKHEHRRNDSKSFVRGWGALFIAD